MSLRKKEHFYIRSVGGESGLAQPIDLWDPNVARECDLDLEIQSIQSDLNMIKTAREALGRVEQVLIQMRTLVLEAIDADDYRRGQIEQEMELLEEAIDKIVADANYSGLNLLDGSMGNIGSIIAAIRSSLGGA